MTRILSALAALLRHVVAPAGFLVFGAGAVVLVADALGVGRPDDAEAAIARRYRDHVGRGHGCAICRAAAGMAPPP